MFFVEFAEWRLAVLDSYPCVIYHSSVKKSKEFIQSNKHGQCMLLDLDSRRRGFRIRSNKYSSKIILEWTL